MNVMVQIRKHALQSTERQAQHNAAIKSLEDRLKALEPAGRKRTSHPYMKQSMQSELGSHHATSLYVA